MKSELKPCPFCGETPKVIAGGRFSGICFVKCDDCKAEICRMYDHVEVEAFECDPYAVRKATFKAWNRRTEDE